MLTEDERAESVPEEARIYHTNNWLTELFQGRDNLIDVQTKEVGVTTNGDRIQIAISMAVERDGQVIGRIQSYTSYLPVKGFEWVWTLNPEATPPEP